MSKQFNSSNELEIRDYIRDIIRDDLTTGRHNTIVTRFPPEPNGYLHIGHAKSICLNFGIANEFGGRCHMRFDDTNPIKEEHEYIDAIQEDVNWLGFEWGENLYFASDHFERLYQWAEHLINSANAYVDDLPPDEIRELRGTLTKPGQDSPYRDRSISENLKLFRQMRDGKFPNEKCVLRAKIDMSSGNINMRDPILYRILHADHPRTGDAWCIYPTYDFAHGQSDAIEGVTHSICTLEFEDHRPLYDWLVGHLPIDKKPLQYEFSRLNLSYAFLSKRKLIQLVKEKHVRGWDDPRLPTLRGLRRRGIPPAAIRDFVNRLAISKSDGMVEIELLEHCVRELMNKEAQRRLAVLRPLKVIIENWPDNKVEELEAVNNPNDADAGKRFIPFSREIYIEQDDFMEEPPRKYFRLAPGREVRLRYAYFIKCHEVIKDDTGQVIALKCTYDPQSRGGESPDGRKVKGTLHWVSATSCARAEVRLYNHLFSTERPGVEGDVLEDLNPQSLDTIEDCCVEPSLQNAPFGETMQFERQGYFCLDPDSTAKQLVFNRTISLRDEWAKIQKKEQTA